MDTYAYLAHLTEDGRTQTILEHLKGTASLCSAFAAAFDAEAQGQLAGMAHDIGDGACPCGGRLVKRKDDEVLPERLAEYEEMTKPAVIELKNEGNNFFWYEGTAEGEDIAREFLEANERYLR